MSEFDDFMTDTITIEPMLLRDSYGVPEYGPPVSYPCRINSDQRQVTDVTGTDRMSRGKIYLMGIPVIGPTDRLTLPAGNYPLQPPILSIDAMTDESGDHHTEITV